MIIFDCNVLYIKIKVILHTLSKSLSYVQKSNDLLQTIIFTDGQVKKKPQSRSRWAYPSSFLCFATLCILEVNAIICKGIWIYINQVHQVPMLVGHHRHWIKTILDVVCLLLFVSTQFFLLFYPFLLPAFPGLEVVLCESLLLMNAQRFDFFLFFWDNFLTYFLEGLSRFGLLLQTFLFFQSFEGLEQFCSALILLHLFVTNFVKKLLSMGPNLAESPATHVLMNFFPVFAISLNELLKQVGLSGAPAASSFPFGTFEVSLQIIHFFGYVRDYTLKLHKFRVIISIYDYQLKESTIYLSKSELRKPNNFAPPSPQKQVKKQQQHSIFYLVFVYLSQ